MDALDLSKLLKFNLTVQEKALVTFKTHRMGLKYLFPIIVPSRAQCTIKCCWVTTLLSDARLFLASPYACVLVTKPLPERRVAFTTLEYFILEKNVLHFVY